jgi:hypothetical protein
LQFSERGALLRKLQNIGSCGAMLRAPVKLIHHQNHFLKFYKAKAGQTDLGCSIFPVLRKDSDVLIYGGPEKFNQSQGG